MDDPQRYLVRRFNWRPLLASPEGTWYTRFPGAVTVAEFDNPHEADDDRWRRELEVRATVNPFRCGLEFPDFTHFPDYALKDYLLDDGVKPAKSDSTARTRWDVWWERQSPNWSADRKARVWEALDKVRFFTVERWPAEGTLHVVVVGVMDTRSPAYWWTDRDRSSIWRQRYGYEGGRPVQAFRRPEDAEAWRELHPPPNDRVNPDRMRGVPPMLGGLPPGTVRSADEVFEVPLAGVSEPDRVFVVGRMGFGWSMGATDPWNVFFCDTYTTGEVEWPEIDPNAGFDAHPYPRVVERPRLVPERAFDSREEAMTDVVEREQVARRLLNPYLVRDIGLRTVEWRQYERRARWWATNIANAPDDQFAQAWEAFLKVQMYHVVEVELDS